MIEAYSPLGRVGDREDWGGACEAETAANFVKDAVTLYSSEAKWNAAASAGMPLLSSQASFNMLCIQCNTIKNFMPGQGCNIQTGLALSAGLKLVKELFDAKRTLPPVMVSPCTGYKQPISY